MRIAATEVTKEFGAKAVLNKINLDVPDGTWLSIVGSSGCGKSTLLNIVAGILDPDSGTAAIGREVSAAYRRSVVAYLLQDFPLYPSLTVYDNLKCACKRQYAFDGPTMEEVSAELQIGGLMKQFPFTLSGGERQRVALGRTLLLHRPVLLLDEPLSNVDVLSRRSIRRYLKRTTRSWHTTAVLVTHDQEDAISTSDVVGVIHDGQLLQVADPARLFESPATRLVADAFGDVQMSWLPVRFARIHGLGNFAGVDMDDGMVGVRETAFRTSVEAVPGYWEVRVLQSEFLGSRMRLFVRHEDWDFTVVIDDGHSSCVRDVMWVQPDLAKAAIYRRGERTNGILSV